MNYEIRKARPQDYDDLIDFANMVFKLDFKPVHPRLYDGHPEQAQNHFLVLEAGKIKALVGSIPMTLHVQDTTLTGYGIGTVSVHPYARGKGYMKMLMARAVEEARQNGADFMCLGGLRQRYEYYGFSSACISQSFQLTPTNRRHCAAVDTAGYTFAPLADAPQYLDDCRRLHQAQPVWAERADFALYARTWQAQCEVILHQGAFAGYCIREQAHVTELLLTPAADAQAVAFALVDRCGQPVKFFPAYYQKELVAALAAVAEETTFSEFEKLQVLNYPRFTQAFLRLKSELCGLPDGQLVFEVTGQGRYAVTVTGGQVTVAPTTAPAAWALPHIQAQNRLFGLGGLYQQGGAFENGLLPIPVVLKAPDMV